MATEGVVPLARFLANKSSLGLICIVHIGACSYHGKWVASQWYEIDERHGSRDVLVRILCLASRNRHVIAAHAGKHTQRNSSSMQEISVKLELLINSM
jgi:hypothetical protein